MSTPETPTPDAATPADATPLLPFERWAEVSALLLKRSADERLDILEEQEIDPAAWVRNDRHWTAQLADDLDRGDEERPERYAARCAEELRARRERALPAGDGAATATATATGRQEIEAGAAQTTGGEPAAKIAGATTGTLPVPPVVLSAAGAAAPPLSFAPPHAPPPPSFATPHVAPPPSFATPHAEPSPSFAAPPAVVSPPALAFSSADSPASPAAPPAAPPPAALPLVTPKPAALVGTMAAGPMPLPGRALPFGNKPSQNIPEPAPAPATASPKPSVSGETLPLGADLRAFVTPFVKGQSSAAKPAASGAAQPGSPATAQPPSAATPPGSQAPAQPATVAARPAPAQPAPVDPGLAQTAPAQAAPAQTAPANPGLAQTAPAQPAPAHPAPAQPGAPAARTSPATPEMTLDAYASLCAEMVVHPQHRADILRRYSIADEATLHALHGQWRERFSRDPALEAQWQNKYKTFRDWLAQRR